ncbi:hypothetical protein C8J57DRAFT_1675000, partial [Mycena rebaudengoi]
EADVIVLHDGGRTVHVRNSHPDSRNGDDDAVPVMTMTKRPAMRETITGGSSAPPARQALLHSKSTPLGQVNKPDVTGETLRAVWRQSRTNAEKSRWWRTTAPEPNEDENTREAATGGEDTPPTRQVRDSDTHISENADEVIIEIHTPEETQTPASDNADATKAKSTRPGKRERRRNKATITNREKQRKREQLTGEGQLSPARQRQTNKTNRSPALFGGEQ